MQRIGWAGFELRNKVHVEVTSFRGLGVDKKSPAADPGRHLSQSPEYILQESRPEPSSLVVCIDPQPSQQSDRLRISPRPLLESFRGRGGTDLCHAPCVVGNNHRRSMFGDDEHPGRSGKVPLTSETS